MSNAVVAADPIAEQFSRNTADHTMTVLHDDGVYRHLRFQNPEGSAYWFELVTWPGALTIHGDMGTYTFARLTDMFEFFRTDHHGINPSYWGQKTPGGTHSVMHYSSETLLEHVDTAISDYLANDGDEDVAAEARAAVQNAGALDDLWDGKKHAGELLEKLERIGVVSGTWEWDLREYDHAFLWCCHAIVWGIAEYDAERVAR